MQRPLSRVPALLAVAATVLVGTQAMGAPAAPAASAVPTAKPTPAAAIAPPRSASEGVIRLRRDGPGLNLDSVLDPNQPDFYLEVTIPQASAAIQPAAKESSPVPATPAPTATPAATPAPTPMASIAPSAAPTVAPSPMATPAAMTSPAPEPSAMPAASPVPMPPESPVASPSPKPAPSASSRPTPPGRSGADLMYQAQRLAQLGGYRQALDLADQGIQLEPDLAPLHALRGSLLLKLGNTPGAEEAWIKALELDPGLNDVRASLDWLHKRRGSGPR